MNKVESRPQCNEKSEGSLTNKKKGNNKTLQTNEVAKNSLPIENTGSPTEINNKVSKKSQKPNILAILKRILPETIGSISDETTDLMLIQKIREEVGISLRNMEKEKEKKISYEDIKSKIESLQKEIGSINPNLKSDILTESIMPTSRSALDSCYSSALNQLQKATGAYLELKEIFGSYFKALEDKILKDQKMSFEIPEAYTETIASVQKKLSEEDIKNGLTSAKEKYDIRYVRARELLLKIIDIEKALHKAAHTMYVKTLSEDSSEFSLDIKEALLKLKTNATDLSSIRVDSLQDWFVRNALTTKSREILSFGEEAAEKRRVYSSLYINNASAKQEELEAHYKTIKEKYMDLAESTRQDYSMMVKVYETLKKQVDAWEQDPQISDYNLQRQGLVRGMTETEIKTKEYKPFQEAHLERKQHVVTQAKELEAYKTNIQNAYKEVQRMYDAVVRKGVFITETRFDWDFVSVYTDKTVILPFTPLEEPKVKKEEPVVELPNPEVTAEKKAEDGVQEEVLVEAK